MKIIYIGGYDPKGTRPTHFYEFAPMVKDEISKGKKVVFVTFAQPAKYFNPRLIEIYDELPSVIDTDSPKNVDWSYYDLIYIPGGNRDNLMNSLKEYGFEIEKLKKDVVIIADSAGAYAVSKYYFSKVLDKAGTVTYKLSKGLNPSSNLLTITHANNPEKVSATMLEEAEKISKATGVKLLILKEYEAVTMENN